MAVIILTKKCKRSSKIIKRLELPIYWNFLFNGTPHSLEVPIYLKSSFTRSPHLLELPIYWNFPFTGTSHLLELPIYWNFPCTGTPHSLEVTIYWNFPFTGSSHLLEVIGVGWGLVEGPGSFPHGMPQKWSLVVSAVLVLDPVMLVMPPENFNFFGF